MIIKNGMIVNGSTVRQSDMRVREGIIYEIKDVIVPDEGEEVIDAEGKFILPGGIDAHTHFDMQAGDIKTSDDFETGTKAAVSGGTTTIIDFAECDGDETLPDGIREWHQKADGKSYCDYAFHMTVSKFDDTTKAQMQSVKEQGILSFKAYTAYKDGIGVEDKELFQIMECVRELGGVLCVHCENGEVLQYLQDQLKAKNPADIRNHPKSRPNLVEKESVSRVIDMAALTGATVYIVHTSTGEAEEEIKSAKDREQKVFAETCPHYLILDDALYGLAGFESAKYVMSPPLRKKADQEQLWQGLQDGTIDTVSTDHCSFCYEGDKELGRDDFTKIPNGIPGVEHRMELMLHFGAEQGMSLSDIVRVTAENPAKIFGLFPQKGVLQTGSDADFMIVEEHQPHTISAKTQKQFVDYTPYEGICVSRQISQVFLRGALVFDHGTCCALKPGGRFLHRKKVL